MYKSITVQNYRGVYRNFNKWPGKYCHVQRFTWLGHASPRLCRLEVAKQPNLWMKWKRWRVIRRREGGVRLVTNEVLNYRSVPQMPPPPLFATLASVQNAGGGAYTLDATISLVITPSLSVGRAWPHCRWEVGAKRETSPSARRRDAPDVTSRLTSFSIEGWGSRQFAFAVVTLTVDSRVA